MVNDLTAGVDRVERATFEGVVDTSTVKRGGGAVRIFEISQVSFDKAIGHSLRGHSTQRKFVA